MMNNIKKILSMVLCLAMLLSMNASAFASEGEGGDVTQCTMNNECTLTEGHSEGCPKAAAPCAHESHGTDGVCAGCGVNVGHSYAAEVTTAATCTADGVKTFSCSVCGDSYTEPVAATGHSYVNGECACGDVAVCNKEETCPANSHEADCLKKQADDAAAAKAAADQAKINEVNGLIAALPNVVTTGNYDAVMAQLETIKAYETEMGELWNQLDLAKLNAVIAATQAPMTLDDCTCTAKCAGEGSVCLVCNANKACTKGEAVAKINGVGYDSLKGALTAANSMSGEVTVEICGKAEYTDDCPSLSGDYSKINFVGITDGAEISITRNGSNGYMGGAGSAPAVSFSKLVLSKPAGGFANDAAQMNLCFTVYRVASVSYTDCTFPNGAGAGGCDTSYTNCVFGKSHDKYAMWLYGNPNVTVVDSKFDCDRGIKMFSVGSAEPSVTVKNSDFSKLTGKPAIVMTNAESVTLSGNTYSDTGTFELEAGGVGATVNSTDPIVCKTEDSNEVMQPSGVLVDGKIYITAAAAAAAATNGSKVTLLHDTKEEVKFPALVEIDKNGYPAANITVAEPPVKIGEKGFMTLQAALDSEEAKTENVVIELLQNATLDITAWDNLAIGADNAKTITINGNGKTLTFNKENSDWNHVATKNNAKLILNNMTITDSGYNDGPWNRYDIGFACSVELNNVTASKALAFKSNAVLKNVTINETGDNYAIWVQPNGNNVINIDGLTVNSAGRGIKIDDQYVGTPGEVKLSVENATFTTAKKSAIMVKSAAGADITVGSNVDITNVAADKTNAVWVDEDGSANFGKVTVSGATVAQENKDAMVAAVFSGDKLVGYHKKLQGAVDAAENGNTVTMLKAQSVADSLVISKNITLDLGELTLSAADTLSSKPVVRVLGNATITNGTVDGTTGKNSYAVIVGNDATAGVLNIADGTYKGITSAISITKGTAIISGGTFSTAHDGEGVDYGAQYLLNCIDENYTAGTAKYNVTGGTFVGFNPENNAAEGANTNFLPWNLKGVEGENGTYTIADATNERAAAKIGDNKFQTLKDAVDAAENGDTVTMLKAQSVDDSIVISENITLDLGGLTLSAADTLSSKPVVRVLGNVTITNGTVDGTTGKNSYAVIVGNDATAGVLNIADGTYKGITSAVSITKGTANISGGTFSTGHDGEGTDYGAQYLLNCIDENYTAGTAKYNVTGGTFVGFNPENNAAEGANTSFVPANFASAADGSNYTVKPLVTVSFNDAEMIRGNAQPSYTYSSNADVHGYTVEVTPSTITLNDNTSTYDITGTVVVKNGSTDVTAKCVVRVTKGTLTVTDAAVKLSSGNTDSYHETLAAASAAAKDGDTVTLLADSAENLAVADNITLALNGNNYTGSVTVASGKQLSMSAADLKTLSDGLKVTGDVKIGNTEIGLENGGTVKVDAKGNLVATPTAAGEGFVAVEVNKVTILLESGSVTVDSNGTANFSNYALVLLADGSVAVLEKGGSVDKNGAVTTTPAEVTDEDGKGVGYGAVTVISKDGKTKTGYLVPAGESLTLKLNSKNVLEPSTAKDVEDPIVDAGADFKDYLDVDPAKKSFYNKSYSSLTFTCNGFIDALEKLEVTSSANNYSKVLTSNECSVTQGSTIVKLKNSYLRNLALGTYTLTYTYADGQTAEATFHVVNTPLTGDYNNLAPFAAVMGFSVLALAIVLVLLKKRRA